MDIDVGPELALAPFVGVVLAGGRASRLGGADKAGVEIDGRTLLAHTLEALVDATEVVVVGEQVPTDRPVRFTLEDPRHGGPAAALLTGLDALLRRTSMIVVVAVDMPLLTAQTVRRLLAAAARRDGSVLVDPGGRRQLAMALHTDALMAAQPPLEDRHNLPLHRLISGLDLDEVSASGAEHRDVDTWADLRELRDSTGRPQSLPVRGEGDLGQGR